MSEEIQCYENSQGDGGSSAPYAAYTVDTVCMVYTVDIVYTVDTVDTVYTIQTALHCLNSSMFACKLLKRLERYWNGLMHF